MEMTEQEVLPEEVETTSEGEILDPVLPQELKDGLLTLLKKSELEDQEIYYELLTRIRRLDLYFNNIVDIFWDEGARDWRIPNWRELEDKDAEDLGFPPRLIPIYRAHAESIIAALSVNTPGTLFFPDDADNPDDLETSEQSSNIATLIERHGNAPIKFIQALAIYFNQGTVFGYNYYRRDKKFGFYRKPIYETFEADIYNLVCPNCGFEFGETDNPQPQETQCLNCGNIIVPEVIPEKEQLTVEAGETEEPKGRVQLEFFGPLHVKAPLYAREQNHCGYLILKFDQSVAFLRSLFSWGDKKVIEDINPQSSDATIDDSFTRYSPLYLGNAPSNTAVVKCVWFRPFHFHLLEDKEVIELLLEKFPTGCYAIFVNDQLVEAYEEDMDEHWTITPNPLSDSIFGEPLGTNLSYIQDIRSELNELELQTVEHGISETFYDSQIIDEDEYKKSMAVPGAKVPVKRAPGEKIQDSFFQARPATMSAELGALKRSYDQDAQFVNGSFPSIYGGAMESGSQTASEYNQSRAQALQRLGITWKIISEFWTQVVSKSVREFINELDYDEQFTSKEGESFRNIYIKRSSLRGRVGHVEPENSDQLPVNWGQIRDTLLNLLTMKNPVIEQVLFHPQNSALLKKAVGLPELFIPGEPDRTRQYREILDMLASEPIVNPQFGMMESSIPIKPEDDDMVHIEICKAFLTSSRGYELSQENPMAIQNITLHMDMHEHRLQQKMMAEAAAQPTNKNQENNNE